MPLLARVTETHIHWHEIYAECKAYFLSTPAYVIAGTRLFLILLLASSSLPSPLISFSPFSRVHFHLALAVFLLSITMLIVLCAHSLAGPHKRTMHLCVWQKVFNVPCVMLAN